MGDSSIFSVNSNFESITDRIFDKKPLINRQYNFKTIGLVRWAWKTENDIFMNEFHSDYIISS